MNIPKPATQHMQFMQKDNLICDVTFNIIEDWVKFKNYSDDWSMLPFGTVPDTRVLPYKHLERILEDYHCVPRTRAGIEEILDMLQLEEYDPLMIVKRTNGVMMNSSVWIKFDDDDPSICWDVVRRAINM